MRYVRTLVAKVLRFLVFFYSCVMSILFSYLYDVNDCCMPVIEVPVCFTERVVFHGLECEKPLRVASFLLSGLSLRHRVRLSTEIAASFASRGWGILRTDARLEVIQKCTRVPLYTCCFYESHAVRNNNKFLNIVAEALRVKKCDLHWLARCESCQIVEWIRKYLCWY